MNCTLEECKCEYGCEFWEGGGCLDRFVGLSGFIITNTNYVNICKSDKEENDKHNSHFEEVLGISTVSVYGVENSHPGRE